MSLSCSSDLLCCEDSNIIIFSDYGDDSPGYTSDLEYQLPEAEESIAELLEDERCLPQINVHQSVDASVRAESVAWILKVQQHYGFQPLTAYLSVNYFDRFLRSHKLPMLNGWPLQLLSTACLSLAAKMEEPLVPSLLDLQVKGAKFIFESRNVQRMELLVLRVLDWRLRAISPFCYLSFFALKIDPAGTYTGFLVSRAKQIILCYIQEASFLEYRPSCIAAAAILCAANDLTDFSLITAQHAESWCDGLDKENITSCYHSMRRVVSNKPKKQPVVLLPRLRVTACSSTTSCNSSSVSSSHKRRKLCKSSWADENEGEET
ncbi:cyclin-D1-1-like [Henckelia pumila]|uniref:cyclin-D1-1-like n=1 Tax=Henckelia pumila TaxID=405737 RepID=UPI003C6DD268